MLRFEGSESPWRARAILGCENESPIYTRQLNQQVSQLWNILITYLNQIKQWIKDMSLFLKDQNESVQWKQVGNEAFGYGYGRRQVKVRPKET